MVWTIEIHMTWKDHIFSKLDLAVLALAHSQLGRGLIFIGQSEGNSIHINCPSLSGPNCHSAGKESKIEEFFWIWDVSAIIRAASGSIIN